MNPRLHDDAVADLPLAAARAELLEEIMSTPVLDRPEPASGATRPRRWLVPLAAAAAVAALVGTPAWLLAGQEDAGKASSSSSSATGSPTPEWVVLTADGWVATYVSDRDDWREVQYEKGDADLSVSLPPAEARDAYVEDRQRINHPRVEPGAPVQLLGAEGLMWHYSATDHTTIGAVAGDAYPEVRGQGMDEATYLELLGQLEWTDEAGFEATLPAEFVTADEQSSVVSEMLSDIALPPGFEMPAVEEKDRYQLGARVAGAAACAWIEVFADAKARGDRQAADEAAGALADSRQWDVLREMDEEGDYPNWIWETADEVSAGRVPQDYQPGLGCL